MTEIAITQAAEAETAAAVEFVQASRAEIFPMLDGAQLPADLQHFAEVYQGRHGCFLLAKQADEIVGAIGYLPYDHRFGQLDYRGRCTVEIVRLYVAPAFRGAGLAGRLYAALKARAVEEGVEVLYLHTHPFLPGAIAFWQKQGFVVTDIEDDPLWQTTHMHCAAR